MATLILDSLVLSSVTVRTVAVDTTLGASGKAKARSSGNRNSMRHPMPGSGLPQPRGVFGPGVEYPTPGQTPEAGWCRA
jgi:hypothetical protein